MGDGGVGLRLLVADRLRARGNAPERRGERQRLAGDLGTATVGKGPVYLQHLVAAVQNAWTGRGLGRAIKIECALEARARGSTRLISSVHRDTAAMRHINDALPGVESEPEIGTAGIFYSVDLTDPGWAQFDRPSEA